MVQNAQAGILARAPLLDSWHMPQCGIPRIYRESGNSHLAVNPDIAQNHRVRNAPEVGRRVLSASLRATEIRQGVRKAERRLTYRCGGYELRYTPLFTCSHFCYMSPFHEFLSMLHYPPVYWFLKLLYSVHPLIMLHSPYLQILTTNKRVQWNAKNSSSPEAGSAEGECILR